MSFRKRTFASLAVAGCLVASMTPARAEVTQPTYTNPVTQSFADTYADPAVIQGKDGWWYAYATADPLKAGDPSTIGHIARTRDWVNWEYVGGIFNDTNRPSWATKGSFLWAPDVRYIDGQYVMYYTVTDTTLNADGWDPAIGVATAPSPAGPWTPTDAPIVAPRESGDGRFFNTIDPAGFTDREGNNYLYFGNYFGGTFVVKLDSAGLKATSGETLIGAWDRYEGSYVTEHDGWYYYQASSANCCAGPATGYSVFVGRSRSPMGPFVDKDGLQLTDSVTGGSLLVTQNGNRWIGAGHHAMATDAQGRDWLVYHALDRNKPWLTTVGGINRRPMLIDRIDWIDGWPVVNENAGPSDTPQPAPASTSLLGITPWDPAASLTRTKAVADQQGGTSARINGVAQTTQTAPGGDLRVRLDVKSSAPTQATLGAGPNQVVVNLDPTTGTLTASGAAGQGQTSFAARAGWSTLTIERVAGRLVVQLSASDLNDPYAVVELDGLTRPFSSAPIRFNANGLVDNLFVARPHVENATAVPVPEPTDELFRDDFTNQLGAGWTWVRPQGDTKVANGQLAWPLKSVDLVGKGGTGALLLRDAPAGDWIAETKFTLDLGTVTNRNYQQAGLVVHASDDDFARLGSVAIWGTRTVEYGRELPDAPGSPNLIYGGAIIGANAPTMWMRIAHHRNAAGEHLYRAGISRDGQAWVWGATWTFGANTNPRIGLYTGGGSSPAATATFDWFRVTSATTAPRTWPQP